MKEHFIDERQYKKHLYRILKFFISICEKHNLTYCCATGTMLGAVRHNDIIPWDDDVDVFMPRKDYEQLLTIAEEIESDGFGLISAKNCFSYATFAKLYNKNTTLWEMESIPFVYGVYIDIFPLDETDDDRKTFRKKYRYFRNLFRKYQLSQMKFSLKRLLRNIKEGDTKMALKDLLSIFVPACMSDHYRMKIVQFEKEAASGVGNHLVSYYGDYWEKEYFDKKWFEDFTNMPFSDFKVIVPKGYHEYLTNVYGDYMKFPPVEKRASHHYHYYLNMDKGMGIEEVRKVMKRNS